MKVNSSMISEISDWKEVNGQGQMDVTFPNGTIYRYFNVPKGIYEKLLAAESIGRFFDLYIKKAGYQYEIVGEKTLELDPDDLVLTAMEGVELAKMVVKYFSDEQPGGDDSNNIREKAVEILSNLTEGYKNS